VLRVDIGEGDDLPLFPGFLANITMSCFCLVACSLYLFYSVDGSLVMLWRGSDVSSEFVYSA
jgi:hypothetical protein